MKQNFLALKFFLSGLIFVLSFNNIFAQGSWTQKQNLPASPRAEMEGGAIGDVGYVGTGGDDTSPLGELWGYHQINDTWNQLPILPGPIRENAVSFTIGNCIYFCTGLNGQYLNDLWEYNTVSGIWTQKANFPGGNRAFAVGFAIENKGYLMTGTDGNSIFQDLWEWDQLSDTWSIKNNFPGQARTEAVAFVIGTRAYLCSGRTINNIPLGDLWEYDSSMDAWNQKPDLPAQPRYEAVAFSIGNCGFVGTGLNNSVHFNDFYQYDQISESWSVVPNFPGTPRRQAFGFQIGIKGYVGTGQDAINLNSDLWEYFPLCNISGTTNPLNQSSFVGGSAQFIATNPLPNTTFRWEGDMGSGFQPLINGQQYNGVFNDTLDITNLSLVNNGFQYRCVITNGPCSDTSDAAILTVSTCNLNIINEPQDQYTVTNSSLQINVVVNNPNSNYQWQSNPCNTGWINLSNNGFYSGVNSDVLVVNNIQLSNHEQEFRLIASFSNCIDTSLVCKIFIEDTCVNILTIVDTNYVTFIDTLIYIDSVFVSVIDTLIIDTKIADLPGPNNINTIKIFPNPTNDHIIIDFGDYLMMSGYYLRINNQQGQVILNLLINQPNTTIDLSTWGGAGLYFVHILNTQLQIIETRQIVLQ